MPLRTFALLLLSTAAAGCSQSTAPSPEQNRALDDAGELLDAAPESLNQVDDNGLTANESAAPGRDR